MTTAYIVAAARIAGGKRGGRLKDWHPADLGGAVIDAVLERSAVDPNAVEDVVFGCVSQVGQQAYNIARYSILVSNLPETVPGVTIDRQCGSSQQAIQFAAQAVMSGAQDVVIAGGVESMTRVPIMSPGMLAAEKGMGGPESARLLARRPGFAANQFAGAEMLGRKYGFTRDDTDAFGLSSHQKAAASTRSARFRNEIVPVSVQGPHGNSEMHETDEGIRFDANLAAVKGVRLVQEGGIISAATSSQICDGASAVLVANERALKSYSLTPLARIHQMTVLGGDPVIMLETPIPATALALKKAGMKIEDIDLYEVNEAFATVPLAWLKATGADPERLNVNGGAIALGHPLGASGAKLTTTLIHALKDRNKRYGLQTMCEGGGLANVTIYEAL
jgi:acetyl-CoA C-acetyltransferase